MCHVDVIFDASSCVDYAALPPTLPCQQTMIKYDAISKKGQSLDAFSSLTVPANALAASSSWSCPELHHVRRRSPAQRRTRGASQQSPAAFHVLPRLSHLGQPTSSAELQTYLALSLGRDKLAFLNTIVRSNSMTSISVLMALASGIGETISK